MLLNIHVAGLACAPMAVALLSQPKLLSAQTPCPRETDSVLASAWRAYRSDSLPLAHSRFTQAHDLCPDNLDAKVGMGFTLLRSGQARRADTLFGEVLAKNEANSDAWEGKARAALRLGDTARAATAALRALDLAPDNQELMSFVQKLAPDSTRRIMARLRRPATLQLTSRTRGSRFEVRTPGGWSPFYIQGVNMGVALPGLYPSQFPTDSVLYAGWLDTLATMQANTLRLYTIFPPSFYRALRAWNLRNPRRPLRLLHGVWTELPPKHDFNHPKWRAEFQTEMRRVVDVVHGAASLPVRPGHAAGSYDADVSPWVLGYIIGREWEPFAVKAFDAQRKSPEVYGGRYLRVKRAPAMDVWLAQQCDLMLAYEVDTYNALRPIAYTNWPTLDPLTHPTEASTAEEAAWRVRSGRKSEAKKTEYENDVLGLDANLVEPTDSNPAGWFASYHAYPYYPDFMMLDPGYRSARSSEGPSSYFGYLSELVKHHADLPVVIAEYGVPSSRGIAHLHPQGWTHGGHDERAMAAIDARLTREIRESGAAGAVIFAWMDEWFKKNWAVIDYEIPLDNTRLWHNVMDAEQNYGIMGMYAGEASASPELGGDPGRWRRLARVQSAQDGAPGPRGLRAGADESFYYLAVELAPGRFAWDSFGIQLALDTHLPKMGQHRLPQSGVRSEVGFEFMVDLQSPGRAALRVTPDYNRHDTRVDPTTGDDFGRFARRPVITKNRGDARFDSLYVITNRARFGRDGTFYPARGYDRGRLIHAAESSTTLADWYLDEKAGLLELRIPWDLLNVTDPSSGTLLDDRATTGPFGTARVVDFRVGVVVYRKGDGPAVVGTLPGREDGVWRTGAFAGWRWNGWSEPRYYSRLKPVYDSLRLLWREAGTAAPAGARARPARPAPSD